MTEMTPEPAVTMVAVAQEAEVMDLNNPFL